MAKAQHSIRTPIGRRWLAAFIISGLTLTGVLTSCSNDTPSNDVEKTTTAKPTENENGGPIQGGTLVFGTSEVTSGDWDPQQNFGTTAIQVSSLVFDSLVYYNADAEIVPGLATEWTQVDDTHLQLTLREGVTWHDGTPFTGEDVKATIERVANDPAVAHYIFWTHPVTVEVDGMEVTIVTETPFAPLLNVLCVTPIASAAQLAKPDELNSHPIGTGYFKFDTYDGSNVKLAANDDYWNGRPNVDAVEFRLIADHGALISAVTSGEVDITYRVSPADLDTLAASDQIETTNFPVADNTFLAFNMASEVFQDVRVRQAVAHAIDRPGIVSLFRGSSSLPDSPLPVGGPGHTSQTQYDYDPAKAKSLLEEAGAVGATINYPTSNGIHTYQEQIDQIIIQSLEAAGFTVNASKLETGTFRADIYNDEYDLHLNGWFMLTGDPDFSFSIYVPPLGETVFHWTADDTFMGYFDAQRQELDQDARQQILNDLQTYAWDNMLASLPLNNPDWVVAYNKRVVGYQHGPTFAELLHDVYLAS